MIGIVVTGHLNFATGFQSALSAISGDERQIEYVDFLESYSTSDLEQKLREASDRVDTGDGVLFLSDIPGGSPFQRAAQVAADMSHADVIAGTNLVMAAEACMERDDLELNALVEQVLEVGVMSIKSVRSQQKSDKHSDSATGDGI
ncbi:PTS galactosamine/N-acetylgalactosamine transporter subunit IIA [Endozoicomonas lisbonensis]|uniref:PTS system N-acetylgalactosamine-specific IIA component n=1 Tax=Endozoicomonas lisbonensis TaxID=3120522 RepID=A0ABV2SC62_9GAMM